MPELPEVEVVKQGLQILFKTQPRIQSFQFLRHDLRDPIPVAAFAQFKGAKILRISRRAKYLVFETERGPFISHLGMTGVWRHEKGLTIQSLPKLHDHIRVFLETGICLVYRDPRRFGLFDVLDSQTKEKRFGHLGPEPLSSDFDGLSLWKSLRGRSSPIKTAIMDQKIVVGVGNIYASESLFLAGIKPQTKGDKISKVRADTLSLQIKKVLESAIQAGGSTISDFASAEGASGYFQTQFKVYDRAGLKCTRCRSLIRVTTLAGRSTFWCPVCQS